MKKQYAQSPQKRKISNKPLSDFAPGLGFGQMRDFQKNGGPRETGAFLFDDDRFMGFARSLF